MNITPLSQRDTKWASVKLGNGTGTIGNYGCLLTIVTVAVNAFGANLRVDEANEKLKAVGGFAGDTKNLLVWSALPKTFPQVKSNGIPETYNNDVAKEMISKGFPVIVEVDGAPIGAPSHWVLLIGNSQMVDPWTGKIESTSKYAIRKMVKWELQGSQSTTDLEACLMAHKKAVDDYALLDKEYKAKKEEWTATEKRLIAEKDQAIKDKEVMISNLRGEIVSANAYLKTEQDANAEKKETIKKLEEDVREFNLSLSTMQAERDEALAQKVKAENEAQGMVAEVTELRQKVLELEGELSSRPIPYKKLYEEAKTEVEKLTEKMDKDMIPYAKHKILKALQQVAYDLDTRLQALK